MIDASTEIGKQALERLNTDQVIWLTTVGATGTPQPRPVWFLWEDGAILIYTVPTTAKLKHINAHPRVSLNFNSDRYGSNVVVILGDAHVDTGAPPAHEATAYIQKYRDQLPGIGLTPEGFAARYNTAIRVSPTKVRGFS